MIYIKGTPTPLILNKGDAVVFNLLQCVHFLVKIIKVNFQEVVYILLINLLQYLEIFMKSL